ncbi:Pln1p KNAG_0C01340 [Huiozyma naganishii CBS 8797]|uniref:Uncharacterized protein n=1 Tax=Huiozyma naganishii (strain ATCC MYA-139 / BCRC 22969 / CBS 8797 / KCTC 17520 / NBRC 10181 / NCYC 3082 / Yp74L-3) TaxID=1071383 RepID=J7RW78_HUIN7|nr:hypothetical protein KNAG_0C01340 [Kazachstania naganishii CBS 8797]CCK69247.1 hypothetical protein KNAG_0C01340 [Kazachstania naganishii CBS 8797]
MQQGLQLRLQLLVGPCWWSLASTSAMTVDSVSVSEKQGPEGSPSWKYLQEWSLVQRVQEAVPSPLVQFGERVGQWWSQRSPPVVQRALQRADALFALLVLEMGVSAVRSDYEAHGGKWGSWVLLFLVDYYFTVVNVLLQRVLSLVPALSGISSKLQKNGVAASSDKPLQHLQDLAQSTATVAGGLRRTVEESYIGPTVDTARDTYRDVHAQYEDNLSKADSSVPKALYTTGVNLGAKTLGRIEQLGKKLPQRAAK